MTPAFAPKPHEYDIPIYIARVNNLILRTAGELCDGLHAHTFTSPKYPREFVLPNIDEGLKKVGRARKDFAITAAPFVIVARDQDEIKRAREGVREGISFYASTRTYQVVLETHDWGGVAPKLNELAAKGDWSEMPNLITDEMLETYAVTGHLRKHRRQGAGALRRPARSSVAQRAVSGRI
jgi:alkanesulfonate monooxygenase SsuD/methylene tetrahydromethanopterin reductase-like flavin-dependent oxidoreductase (luciferase family)